MKRYVSASFLLLFAYAAPVFGEEKTPAPEENTFAPKEKQLSNYDGLRKKSPFEFDPPKVVEAQVINPFEGISLAGYCGSGNTLTVYLLEGKEKKRLTVYGDGSPYKERDDSGFRVVGINRGRSLKATEVVLEKDGRQGTVKFEDDTLRSKAAAPQGGVQMVRDQNGNMVPRQVIPRPAGAAQQTQMYQAPAPFIPGQNAPANPQQQQQGGANPGNPVNNLALPPGQLTNQQLMNHLTGPNGGAVPQPAAQNPAIVQPQGQPQPQPGGGGVPPPSRRRVVLPTQ
jgi:hypothetical protein